MLEAHGRNVIILFFSLLARAYDQRHLILHTGGAFMTDPRVISVVLSDEEWKALLRVQPQPVAWLRERISEVITSESARSAAGGAYTTSSRSH